MLCLTSDASLISVPASLEQKEDVQRWNQYESRAKTDGMSEQSTSSTSETKNMVKKVRSLLDAERYALM